MGEFPTQSTNNAFGNSLSPNLEPGAYVAGQDPLTGELLLERVEAPAADQPLTPLFAPIERDRPVETGESTRLVSTSEALRAFGAPDAFVKDNEALAVQLGPLSGLGLNRMPEGAEREGFEGRGAYHTIPRPNAENGEQITVYVKGGGSHHAMQKGQPERKYPAHPDSPDNMIYDTVHQPGDTARVKGALSAAGACLEQINAAAIVGTSARENDWQTAQAALEAGATIPLGAHYLPGLTEHVGTLVARYIESGSNLAAREALSSWRTGYLATTALLVPAARRVQGGIDMSMERLSEPDRITDAHTIGATIRTLAGASGTSYSRISGHRQNFYAIEDPTRRQYAQADNHDLVTLGAHSDREMASNVQVKYGVGATIPKSVVREALLFMPLDRGNIIPDHLPSAGRDDNAEALTANIILPQVAFWSALLEGLAKSEAIARIPELAPYMLKEFEIAAAVMLYENADQDQWEMVARQKDVFIATIDARYGVAEEHASDQTSAITDTTVAVFDQALRSNRLAINYVKAFLETGNEEYLRANYNLESKLDLQQAVAAIEDTAQRNQLTRLLGSADLQFNVLNESRPETVMDEFEGIHYSYLMALIREGEIGKAMKAAEILSLISAPHIRGELALGGNGEQLAHYYASKLFRSGTDEDLETLRSQAHFEVKLQTFCKNLLPTPYRATRPDAAAPFETKRAEAAAALAQGSHNMDDYTTAYGLPPVGAVVRWIVSGAMEHSALQSAATTWLENYSELHNVVNAVGDRNSAETLATAYDLLDSYVSDEGLVKLLPELVLAHNAWMATQLENVNPDRAHEYFKKAIDYYEHALPERHLLGTVDPYSMTPSESGVRPTWLRTLAGDGLVAPLSPHNRNEAIAAMYDRIPLPTIAAQYRQ